MIIKSEFDEIRHLFVKKRKMIGNLVRWMSKNRAQSTHFLSSMSDQRSLWPILCIRWGPYSVLTGHDPSLLFIVISNIINTWKLLNTMPNITQILQQICRPLATTAFGDLVWQSHLSAQPVCGRVYCSFMSVTSKVGDVGSSPIHGYLPC